MNKGGLILVLRHDQIRKVHSSSLNFLFSFFSYALASRISNLSFVLFHAAPKTPINRMIPIIAPAGGKMIVTIPEIIAAKSK